MDFNEDLHSAIEYIKNITHTVEVQYKNTGFETFYCSYFQVTDGYLFISGDEVFTYIPLDTIKRIETRKNVSDQEALSDS